LTTWIAGDLGAGPEDGTERLERFEDGARRRLSPRPEDDEMCVIVVDRSVEDAARLRRFDENLGVVPPRLTMRHLLW
jgi:hypothetical protein